MPFPGASRPEYRASRRDADGKKPFPDSPAPIEVSIGLSENSKSTRQGRERIGNIKRSSVGNLTNFDVF